MSYLPKAPVDRMMRDTGCKRVSQGAKDLMIEHMEAISRDISIRANALARHAGRETVRAEDVKMALGKL